MTKQGLIIAIDGDMATVEGCKNIKCDHCPKRSRIGACDACPDHEEKISERVIAYN